MSGRCWISDSNNKPPWNHRSGTKLALFLKNGGLGRDKEEAVRTFWNAGASLCISDKLEQMRANTGFIQIPALASSKPSNCEIGTFLLVCVRL